MRVMANTDPDDVLRQVRAQAAILGAFDPTELLNPSQEAGLVALQRFAPECDEVVEGGKALWVLHPDVRAQTLRELPRQDLLRLLDTVQPAVDDRLGQLLQTVLRGGAIDTSSLPMPELGLLRTALHLAGRSLDTKVAAREVDLLLSRRDAEQSTQVLLPGRLVGRRSQLAKLRQFVFGASTVAAESILWITGAGGTGKSALLAEFAHSLRGAQWNGTPVLNIDFDRPAIFSGTLSSLMMEFSRQLELFFPEMEPALSEYRRAIRSSVSAQLESDSFESVQQREHRGSSTWQVCMRAHLPIEREVVLILDTAEEVGLSSEFDLAGLRRWLRQLRVREGLPKLKVVLSGRAFDADQTALVPRALQIELGDLPRRSAVTLLSSLLARKSVEESLPLERLVDMLGGNPLMLKILAAYLAESGEQGARQLLSDRKSFDKRFAQSFLYKRILGRLRSDDKDLVKVAHPGLVLRRVTPDLIQHVLAGPCGLVDVGGARARALFRQLSGQVWLVQGTTNPDVVVHRRDLRRLMLQAMTAEDEARALAIHQSAADYYLQGRDLFLTHEAQRMEGLYHHLFTPGARVPKAESLPAFARTVGEDLETVPRAVRAAVKLELGRRLTDSELRTLPDVERKIYRSRQARQELRRTGMEDPLATGVLSAAESPPTGDARLVLSELHAAFEAGKLGPVAAGVKTAVEDFAGAIESGELGKREGDFTQSAIWRAALATLRQVPDSLTSALLGTLETVGKTRLWNQEVIGQARGALSPCDAYRMLFRLHGADCPEAAGTNGDVWDSGRVRSAQDLRRFQLSDKRPGQYAQVSMLLLRDLGIEFQAFFGRPSAQPRVMQLNRDARASLEAQMRLREMKGSVSLHHLDKLETGNGFLTVLDAGRITRDGKDLLLGRIPETYPLVRTAARACTTESLLAFAADACQHVLWPVELAAPLLQEALATERERWTATLIGCIDRFGMLRRFLDWMEDRNRLAKRYKLLLEAVRDYELRLLQFI